MNKQEKRVQLSYQLNDDLRQMEKYMNNRNRNWDANWSQGNGRSAHDYGHTGPLVGMSESSGGAAMLMILGSAVGGLVLALMFFAWIG